MEGAALPRQIVDVDTQVVEDAFAFIDAYYAASRTSGSAADTGDAGDLAVLAGASDALLDLRVELRDLHNTLLAVNRSTGDYDPLTLELERFDIQRRLEQCRHLWHSQCHPQILRSFRRLEDTDTISMLRRRLDEIVACVASGSCERPLLDPQGRRSNDSNRYFDTSYSSDEMTLRFRSGRFIPFKLSILTRAAWSVLVDAMLLEPRRSTTIAYEHTHEMLLRFRDDHDATEGVTALRRTDLPDGSVLLCWTGVEVSSAPPSDTYAPTNSVGDSQVLECGWIRVGRLAHELSTRPRVYLESVNDIVVRASDTCDAAVNAQRFDEFTRSIATRREDKKNVQILENRMLDLSLGRHQ